MLYGYVPVLGEHIPCNARQLRRTLFAGHYLTLTDASLRGLQVSKQPAGKYSVRGHFLRVAPVFAWPPVAWLLHSVVMWLTGWKARRDGARLAAVQARMQKMLADLKVTARPARCTLRPSGVASCTQRQLLSNAAGMNADSSRAAVSAWPSRAVDGMDSLVVMRLQDSTHYEATQAILRKYDPEHAKAQAKEREAARREVTQAPRAPATPGATPVRVPSSAALHTPRTPWKWKTPTLHCSRRPAPPCLDRQCSAMPRTTSLIACSTACVSPCCMTALAWLVTVFQCQQSILLIVQ